MIRVLIVDDQPLIRAALRDLITNHPALELVAEADDGIGAVAAAKRLHPDVVLMDIQMPTMDGIEATRTITAAPIEAKVLILTTFEEPQNVLAAVDAGASGFIGKSAPARQLADAIVAVHAGDLSMSSRAIEALVAAAQGRVSAPDGESAFDALTPRERELVILTAEGLSDDDIATSLSISRQTAKTHINRAMVKLHVGTRAQLVALAYRAHLVHAPR
ncbi:response regulator transcription factor [Microbacterium thalassium]|uniref:DNA-binding NarL/FixJ family response regulator n=1 Tax=Microbacterium thalassium TaxID=362649 RepID=A0A7X0FNZ6_9MICO|nr:response regulator transcription factor [Microbacterium thalassium]MBB6390535.1 DNA-binding NarL/FixJ family response regulator [Microbacterium thalassium]GLK25646.1 DNA-binding response regulator [Microbacterium thalassium]